MVQAIARDVLADALCKLVDLECRNHRLRLRVVGHIHDEIITEARDELDGEELINELITVMAKPPLWAESFEDRPPLVLTAKGQRGSFYHAG